MKKIIIFSAICFAFLLAANGQSIKIGVFVDPMISWLAPEGDEANGSGSKIGFDGGITLDKYFQKNYAFQTGISIGTQGGSLDFQDSTIFSTDDGEITLPGGTEVDYRMNYITVPVGLLLRTNEIGYFSYFARVGLTNQFNIKAKATSSDGSLNDSNISDEVALYNLSYYFGIGITYNISEDTALSLGLNYVNGFVDAMSNDDLKAYTRAVTLRLGATF